MDKDRLTPKQQEVLAEYELRLHQRQRFTKMIHQPMPKKKLAYYVKHVLPGYTTRLYDAKAAAHKYKKGE